jgi:hypothetical protein
MAAASREVFPIGQQWSLQFKDSTKVQNGQFNSSPFNTFDEDKLTLSVDKLLQTKKIYLGVTDGTKAQLDVTKIVSDSTSLRFENPKNATGAFIGIGNELNIIDGDVNDSSIPRDLLLFPALAADGSIGDTFIGPTTDHSTDIGRSVLVNGAGCRQSVLFPPPTDPAFALNAGNVHLRSGDSLTYGNGGDIEITAGDCTTTGTRGGRIWLLQPDNPGSGQCKVELGVRANQDKGGCYIISNGVRYELPKDPPTSANDRMRITDLKFNYDTSFGNSSNGIALNQASNEDDHRPGFSPVGLSIEDALAFTDDTILSVGFVSDSGRVGLQNVVNATLPGPILQLVWLDSTQTFLCCGSGFIATSADLETEEWTVRVSTPGVNYTTARVKYTGLPIGGVCLIVPENSHTAYFTDDGAATFQTTTLPLAMSDFTSACFDEDNDRWCVCTSSGPNQIATAPADLSVWTAEPTGFDIAFGDIAFAFGEFVLIPLSNSDNIRLWNPVDGFRTCTGCFGTRVLYSRAFARVFVYNPIIAEDQRVVFVNETVNEVTPTGWTFALFDSGGNSFPFTMEMLDVRLTTQTLDTDHTMAPKIMAQLIRNDRYEFYTSFDGVLFAMDYIIEDTPVASIAFTNKAVAYARALRQMVFVLDDATQMVFADYTARRDTACLQLYSKTTGAPDPSFGLNGIRYLEVPAASASQTSRAYALLHDSASNRIFVCCIAGDGVDYNVMGDTYLMVFDDTTFEPVVDPVLVESTVMGSIPTRMLYDASQNVVFVLLNEYSYAQWPDYTSSRVPPKIRCVDTALYETKTSFGASGDIIVSDDLVLYGYLSLGIVGDIIQVGTELVICGHSLTGGIYSFTNTMETVAFVAKYSAIDGSRVDTFGNTLTTPGYRFYTPDFGAGMYLLNDSATYFMFSRFVAVSNGLSLSRLEVATGDPDLAFNGTGTVTISTGLVGLDPRLFRSAGLIARDDIGAYWLSVKQPSGFSIPEYSAVYSGAYVFRFLNDGTPDLNFAQNGVLFIRVNPNDPAKLNAVLNVVNIAKMVLLDSGTDTPDMLVCGTSFNFVNTRTDDTASPEYVRGQPPTNQSALIKVSTSIDYAIDVILSWSL